MLTVLLISIIFYGLIIGVLTAVSYFFSKKHFRNLNILVAHSLFSE